MFAPQMESIAALYSLLLGVADFSLELIDVLLNALISALPPQSSSIGFNNIPTVFVALLGGLMLLAPFAANFRVGAVCAWLP